MAIVFPFPDFKSRIALKQHDSSSEQHSKFWIIINCMEAEFPMNDLGLSRMGKPLSISSISKACTQTMAMASYQNTNAKSQILNAAEVTPKVGL